MGQDVRWASCPCGELSLGLSLSVGELSMCVRMLSANGEIMHHFCGRKGLQVVRLIFTPLCGARILKLKVTYNAPNIVEIALAKAVIFKEVHTTQ